MRFQTPYNYDPQGQVYEDFKKPSETIPSQALTVKEILDRFTSNTLPNIAKTPYYDENADIENPDPTANPDFDLADYTALSNSLAASKSARESRNSGEVLTEKEPSEPQKIVKDGKDQEKSENANN